MKHGVGFDGARGVFSDPHVIIYECRIVEDEDRLHANRLYSVLLFVHTVRVESVGAIIRIISARKATPAERKLYEETE